MEIPAWSLPAGSGNFSWRKLGSDNVAEVGSLIHRIEEFDNPPFRTAISEVEDFFCGSLQLAHDRRFRFRKQPSCLCAGASPVTVKRSGL